MSCERVGQTAHPGTPLAGGELHVLDVYRDIEGGHLAYHANYQSAYLSELDHAHVVKQGPSEWQEDNPLPLISASHSPSPNLPRRPQTFVHENEPVLRQQRKITRANYSKKEKKRPATFAVLEPVSPMSSTTSYAGSRRSVRSASRVSARRGQSAGERRGDKENCFFPPRQSPGVDRATRGEARVHYERADSTCLSYLPAVSPPSFSSCASTDSLDQPISSLGFPPAAGATIYLVQQGEVVAVYLDSLADSPDDIIALLKAASQNPSECAKWMMVAAHYRSKGNTLAALTVVTTMVEVMSAAGLDLSQLKPAVLMRSSCHLDYAKRLRALAGEETYESKYHFAKGCDGLRQIYGPHIPLAPSMITTQGDIPPFCSSAVSMPSNPDSTSRRNIGEQRAPPNVTPSFDDASASPEFTARYSQVKILEREVQSLRDRQEDQSKALNRTRIAKRKLEDDLEAERHIRRRLEQRLDMAELDASGAQKGEKSALEQCRAEVETRRRAEERAEGMRQEAAEVRAALEPKLAEYSEQERNLKDFFGKLGIVFLKAARGEFTEVLNGRL